MYNQNISEQALLTNYVGAPCFLWVFNRNIKHRRTKRKRQKDKKPKRQKGKKTKNPKDKKTKTQKDKKDKKKKRKKGEKMQVGRRLSRSNKQLSVFTSSSLLHSIKVNGDEDDAKA